MSTMSTANELSHFICSAGGSSSGLGGLECLNDLEAGKLLLDWLAAQVDSTELDEEGLDEEERERRLFASTRDLVLEKGEVLLLSHARSSDDVDKSNEHLEPPPDYMPLSRLQKHSEYINNETDLVRRERDMFRTRISQTKDACQKFTQSIKLLLRAVFDLDSQVRRSEERLSELSINADTIITSTLDAAESTLRDLGIFGGDGLRNQRTDSEPAEEGSDLASARVVLLMSQNELSRITIALRKNLGAFSSLREQELTRIEGLHAEVNRLQMAFTLKHESKDLGKKASRTQQPSAQCNRSVAEKELEDICITLEHEVALKERDDPSTGDALDILISGLDDVHQNDSLDEQGIPVLEMMQTAWALDQEAILNLQEEIMDEALSSYDLRILPMELLHASLSDLACRVQDADATLEALGEELGEIHLNDAWKPESGNRNTDQGGELEQRLKLILNDFENLRQADGSPMVLLTSDDILAELRALKGRSDTLEASESLWADKQVHEYSARPLNPALTKVYSNSPLNSTPPFAFHTDLRELEAQTRAKTAELQKLANSLEEEVRETLAKQNHLRRLTSFTEKCMDIEPKG